MAYTAKDYNNLIGMEGFSETLLKNHFTLYQGYVTNTNKGFDTLSEMAKGGRIGTSEYAELKRRLGWEFNGMRLHEFYFENLGGKGALNKSGKLGKKLAEEFGSYENWEADFKGVGAMRGSRSVPARQWAAPWPERRARGSGHPDAREQRVDASTSRPYQSSLRRSRGTL